MKHLRPSSFRVSFTLVWLALAGCYETSSLREPVRSPNAPGGCVELADRVFFDAGYVKINATTGAMVYTPRGPAISRTTIPFQWAIGVWMPEKATSSEAPRSCDYELQAVSADPSCDVQCPLSPAPVEGNAGGVRNPNWNSSTCVAVQCPLSPQPGAQYDQATREMAQRLRSGGAATVSTSGAVPAAIQ